MPLLYRMSDVLISKHDLPPFRRVPSVKDRRTHLGGSGRSHRDGARGDGVTRGGGRHRVRAGQQESEIVAVHSWGSHESIFEKPAARRCISQASEGKNPLTAGHVVVDARHGDLGVLDRVVVFVIHHALDPMMHLGRRGSPLFMAALSLSLCSL